MLFFHVARFLPLRALINGVVPNKYKQTNKRNRLQTDFQRKLNFVPRTPR